MTTLYWAIESKRIERLVCDPHEVALLRLRGAEIVATDCVICQCGAVCIATDRFAEVTVLPRCNQLATCDLARTGNIGNIVQTACVLLSEAV